MNAIETRNLTRRYGRTLALDGLNLAIPTGEIYGFVGPNGAGKTTTMRLLAGLLEPSAGEIRLLGEPMDRRGRTAQRMIGYMPDFFGVYDDLRVWEYLDFWARCYGLPANKRRSTIDGLLDLVDLSGKREAFVQALSRGMQQRLALAHALVHDPPILLLDEPASGLDPRARVELRELLRTLRDMGKTIVLSSHILSELAEVSTALGIIQGGRLIADGSFNEVRQKLGGGNRLRVTVLDQADKAQVLLRAMPGVTAIEIELDEQMDHMPGATVRLPEIQNAGPASLLVSWEGDDDAAADLLARLVAAGIPVRSFADVRGDLEDLFLQLTASPTPVAA